MGRTRCWAFGSIRNSVDIDRHLLHCRKQIGADRARAAVGECLHRFIILVVDRALLEMALHLVSPDFEDDVQIASAQTSDMHLIITRNVADFAHGSIPALTQQI